MSNFVLDLNKSREQRRAALAAKDSVAGTPMYIEIGDAVIGPLPVELPLAVLAPLMEVDVDLALLFQDAISAFQSGNQNATTEMLQLFAGLIVSNPALPKQIVTAIQQVAINLLGEQGWADLQGARPSGQDYMALLSGLGQRYGSLGEAMRSTEPSPSGGPISSTTSSPSAEGSTPVESGSGLVTPGSSPSAPLQSASGG